MNQKKMDKKMVVIHNNLLRALLVDCENQKADPAIQKKYDDLFADIKAHVVKKLEGFVSLKDQNESKG